MGMMGGGGPMGILNQVMQTIQQMQQQQGSSECGGCSEGGQQDPGQMFQQILQQLTQGQG
jgi:hypothetical protein